MPNELTSLEIVNENIAFIVNNKAPIKGCCILLSDLNVIKQDLEVLEIFKALMFHNIKSIGFKSSIKSYEALFNMGIITKEQLEKLKQWLKKEGNKQC